MECPFMFARAALESNEPNKYGMGSPIVKYRINSNMKLKHTHFLIYARVYDTFFSWFPLFEYIFHKITRGNFCLFLVSYTLYMNMNICLGVRVGACVR